MKTLDEVITALEKCTDYEAECEGCPYREDNTGGLECVMRNLDDVLHYLKEYQTILPLVPSLINTAIAVQKKGKTIG